jgi:hypothetical protein
MRRVGLDYEHLDWPGLYKRLCVFALRLTRGLPDVLDGTSVEDLAEDTLTDFFASPDALGWDGRDLAAFLCGVLRNKFLTRLRRQKRMAGSLDDEDFTRRHHRIAEGQVSAEYAVVRLIKELTMRRPWPYQDRPRQLEFAILERGGRRPLQFSHSQPEIQATPLAISRRIFATSDVETERNDQAFPWPG